MGPGTLGQFLSLAPLQGRISGPALAWKILPEAPSPQSQLTDSVT